MSRKYYVLCSCDSQKAYSSMTLMGVFTRSRLNKVISEQVKQGNFELEDNKKPTISDIKQFCYASDLNNALTYAYIEEVEINEEL